ncbi:MAG: hypothetical protein LPK28_01950 [Bacteroidota bacterium]|nr:hypothetical protein [Bacteroidota bacterium]
MHDIEPHYNWRHLYVASEDERSPFHGYFNSEVYFTDVLYDHLIHPQWDNIGSPTLFLKILYVNYSRGFSIIELFGEWNDLLSNDIMILKRDIIEPMIAEGIDKFILIGENILNMHADGTDYYEEWFEEVEDGWIALLNFREHVIDEMTRYGLDHFLVAGGRLNELSWRSLGPEALFKKVETLVMKRLG